MWLYFPAWHGEGIEPELNAHLRSQNIHSCTNCSLLLKLDNDIEALRLCSAGIRFQEQTYLGTTLITPDVADSWRRNTERLTTELNTKIQREESWHKHIQQQSRLITELQAENERLRRDLTNVHGYLAQKRQLIGVEDLNHIFSSNRS